MEAPLILTLDSHGVPHRWVPWQQACFYYAKNLVAWSLGESTFTYYGGISRITGERSSITAHSIIAIKGKALAAAIKGAVGVVVPNCGHFTMIERPDETLDALKGYV